jgi:PAS domain S-box-containing protein
MNIGWQKIKFAWKRLSIESRGSIAVSIPLICLIGTVTAYTLLRQRMIEAQLYVNHTNQILAESQDTLISLLNAETGVRGYYIGKQRAFLEPYNLAITTVKPALDSLQKLAQDNPSQIQRVKILTEITQDRMTLLQGTIQRVETNNFGDPGLINERLQKGKRSMDLFRKVIDEIEVEENRLLRIHTQSLQEQQNLNTYVIWGGVLVSIGGSVLAMRLLKELAKEMRLREIRLLESRNLSQAIMTNVVDGVLVINKHGKIETFNGAAVQMFGYQHFEVVGWPWQKLLSPKAESTQKLLNYGHDLDVMNTESIWQAMGQRKDGEWFPIEISVNNIALDDDRIVIIRDITDRQQAAAKLRAKAVQMLDLNDSLTASNQSLLQINHELDQFAYITSHDLKAPLRAIASLSEWIEEDLDKLMSTETRSQMHLLRSRVYRMQALLNGLLEYSQAGRQQSVTTMVDVNQLLTKVIQALAPPDTFAIKIESSMPVLNTRERPLQQVFSHLIDNAIRHHLTKTGTVNISVVDQGDRYEFAVADDGEGIEPQFQEKIYTIFQTLKARDRQENIGVGLAIVRKIVASEGGAVHLESTFGQGSTFRFTWLKQPISKEKTLAGEKQQWKI